jgi:hypothetical protein
MHTPGQPAAAAVLPRGRDVQLHFQVPGLPSLTLCRASSRHAVTAGTVISCQVKFVVLSCTKCHEHHSLMACCGCITCRSRDIIRRHALAGSAARKQSSCSWCCFGAFERLSYDHWLAANMCVKLAAARQLPPYLAGMPRAAVSF